MPEFVRGRELSEALYAEAVRPLLASTPHSAAFLGWGSDVLGLDTVRSTDHGWGPRLQVFVAEGDVADVRAAVEAGLPDEVRGWPTRFGWDDHPVEHHVEVSSLGDWLERTLGFDASRGISQHDWLTTPQQLLLHVTAGAVFHDDSGELGHVRAALGWYPDDVWLWLLACQWRRLDQEEPFVGRTADVGDELGSRVIAARLARDVVRLAFLLERRYAPYSKWLGSVFRTLAAYPALGPPLERALQADAYPERERALVEAVVAAAQRHNELGLTRPVDPTPRLFHSRPFRVLGSGRFVDACLDRISDPGLTGLPLVGSVDQLADSVDLLSSPEGARRLGAVYGDGARDANGYT